MPMSSHEIGAMAMQQQAMFGNFQSYAQQITPPYAGGGASQMGGNPVSGYGQSPPTYQPAAGGFMTGPPPAPPPMMPSMPSMGIPQYGGLARMGMQVPYAAPGSYVGQAFGEQLAGTALGGLASGMQGLGTVAGVAGLAGAGMGMLGIGGAAAGGLAMAGSMPVTMGLAAGAYGANQMYAGFQQHQQVNRVLKQNFGGMMGVGSGRGGMGFSAQEMGGISDMMREMSANDMFTGFDELTRTMDKTAQMGMYRGVQSAKEFKQKFRQTVESLKEIAQTMHTSLEEATQFMGQAKQMGFYSGSEINQQLMKTRMTAGATGLSMDQLQQAGMMGTQMGRSMGMLGRHGAQAMQETTANLAMGMRTGAISTELIAEATGGLTGAEGAQAAAGRMMQINQRWLRRGVGQVELAALWDPSSGGINQETLEGVRGGNISFQEMRRRGRRNIAQTGGRQSSFFLDEERLRGQAMAAGGGDLMLGALRGHLDRRGVGMDSPIAQRWLQRQAGMSRSEADLFIEQARSMPRIMEERRIRTRTQIENEARTRSREGSGISGLKRRLSNMWEKNVENPLRQAGADLTTSFEEAVEGAVRDLEGSIELRVSQRTKDAMEELATTGKGGYFKGAMKWQEGLDIASSITRLDRGPGGINMQSIGRMLGTRPESVTERLENLGVGKGGSIHGEYFRQMVRPGGGPSREVSLSDKVSWLNKFNTNLRMTGSQFKFSNTEMEGLGTAAREVLQDKYGASNVDAMRAMEARRNEALGDGAELEQFLDQRIAMYSQSSPELAKAFRKAKVPSQRYALLREVESQTGLGEGDVRLSPVKKLMEIAGGTSNLNLAALIDASENRQEEVALKFAESFSGGSEWVEEQDWAKEVTGSRWREGRYLHKKVGGEWKKYKRKVKRSELGPGRTPVWAANQQKKEREFAESLLETLSDSDVRELTTKALSGDEDALQQLANMGADTKNKDREDIQKIVQTLSGESQDKKDRLRNLLAGDLFGEIVGAFERESKTGEDLARSLSSNEGLQEAIREAGPGAMDDLQAITDARQAAYKNGRIDYDSLGKAYELERKFYARYGNDEKARRMVGALAASGTGTYMSEGLRRAQEVYGIGKQRRGKTRSLLEYTLRERLNIKGLGSEGLGLSEKNIKALVRRMEGDKAISGKEFRELLGDNADAFSGMSNRQIEEAMGDIFGVAQGGVKAEELGAIAGKEAAGVASRGRQQGAGGQRNSLTNLAEQQVAKLGTLVGHTKIMATLLAQDRGMTKEQAERLIAATGKAGGNADGTAQPSGGTGTGEPT